MAGFLHVFLGGVGEEAAFFDGDERGRVAELPGTACFDLHKHEHTTMAGDDIDLRPAEAPVLFQYFVAFFPEPIRCERFSSFSGFVVLCH